MALYEREDYPSMMECASLLAKALAHSLYGRGIVRGDDFITTIFRTLWASLSYPPDGRTFADRAQRAARLALTLTRENGLHPTSMGGSGLFDNLIMDEGNQQLLSAAVGPDQGPWDGYLERFFAVPPEPLVGELPDASSKEMHRITDAMYQTMKKADAGDKASEHHMNGMAMWAAGRTEEALAELEAAAHLGSAAAMKDAGDLAGEIGRADDARRWFELAAAAGSPGALWNLAVLALQEGDLMTAKAWYQRSAEAGLADGYAALTQLARDEDDAVAVRHWARLGAQAGQTFCMVFHGLHLRMDADGDLTMLREAREYFEEAAARGEIDAASQAASLSFDLGDEERGRRFVQMVVDSGDTEEIDRLRRYGYL